MKDSQISDLKQRMEDMAIEFGDMLKETLDKMTDRSAIASISTRKCIISTFSGITAVKDTDNDAKPAKGYW